MRRGKGRILLTREMAHAAGADAANAQKRRAGRKRWNLADWNLAVQVEERLLRAVYAAERGVQ